MGDWLDRAATIIIIVAGLWVIQAQVFVNRDRGTGARDGDKIKDWTSVRRVATTFGASDAPVTIVEFM